MNNTAVAMQVSGIAAFPNTSKLEVPEYEGWDPRDERRVLWKIDVLLMPILTFSYGLQFVGIAFFFQHFVLDTMRILTS